MRRVLPLAFCVLLVAACATTAPAIRHFQLSAEAPASGTASGPRVHVGQLVLPDYLLRNDLLFRRDEFSLHYDSMQRWAEPLDISTRRLIAEQLAAAFGQRSVTVFPAPAAPQTEWTLAVEFQRFEAVDDRAVMIATGVWTAVGEDVREQRSLSFNESLPLTTPGGETVARALSRLLVDFSDQLVATLK